MTGITLLHHHPSKRMMVLRFRVILCGGMAKMLAYFFKIEMLKAAITGSMEKNHYQHDFGL